MNLVPGRYMVVLQPRDKYDFGSFAVRLTCGGSSTTPGAAGDSLKLHNGRFKVYLEATDHRTGKRADGSPIPQNNLFGYFSLPGLTGDANNPEVFVKIVDGTTVNGSFWVFYGGLTDLQLLIRISDGAIVKTYQKEGGTAAGGFDTTAFCGNPMICKR